jgi:hypothetical protein
LGLLAGEAALATCAYLFSYALFLDPAGRRSGLRSLSPYVMLVLVWRGFYQWLGYGASSSGVYVDPVREPFSFFVRLPQTIAVLLTGQFGFPSSDSWFWGEPGLAKTTIAIALATVVAGTALLVPILRSDRTARFWAVGMVVATVPSASSVPGDRLLLFVGVGGMALLAQLFSSFVAGAGPLPTAGLWRAVVGVPILALFVRRVVLAPVLLPIRAHSMDILGRILDTANDAVPKTADIAGRSLIIVNPPTSVLASYIPLMRATSGEPPPRSLRWLATASSDLRLTRVSAQVLRVRPEDGFFLSWPDRLYRSALAPLLPGETIVLEDLTVTVTSMTPDGRPAEADFAFREPLESSDYVWMAWRENACEPFTPPTIGETTVLPRIDFLQLVSAAL